MKTLLALLFLPAIVFGAEKIGMRSDLERLFKGMPPEMHNAIWYGTVADERKA